MVVAAFVAAIGIGQGLLWAVNCRCPCAKTRTKDVNAHYEGLHEKCSTTTQTTMAATLSAGQTLSGSGNYSGSGTRDADCYISYTVTDFHRTHDGSVDACTKVDDDGSFYCRIFSGGGCEHHWVLGPDNDYWTCKDLVNTSSTPSTNQITRDCPGGEAP
jgi:hypothetical protein